MKRFCQGVQAVTVELLGVLLLVGTLFGFTAMGLHSVSGKPPTLQSEMSQQLLVWKEQLATRLARNEPNVERQRYVAHRLGYFSKTYSLAARNHVGQLLSLDRAVHGAGPHRRVSE